MCIGIHLRRSNIYFECVEKSAFNDMQAARFWGFNTLSRLT